MHNLKFCVPLLEVKYESLKTLSSANEKGQTPWSHFSESRLQVIAFGPVTISSKQERTTLSTLHVDLSHTVTVPVHTFC